MVCKAYFFLGVGTFEISKHGNPTDTRQAAGTSNIIKTGKNKRFKAGPVHTYEFSDYGLQFSASQVLHLT